jgi:hypothetical protein
MPKTTPVPIRSEILDDNIWLADPGFNSPDGAPVYHPDELKILANKTHDELKAIHKIKKAFPGSIIRK